MNRFIFLLACLVTFNLCRAQQPLKPFVAGDRVVFVGNSITDGGHYHSYIWLYYMTHFPNRKMEMFNAGIGGDVAEQIYNRFDEDVITKKPTVVTVTFGMNDTRYFEFTRPDAKEIAKKSVQTSYESYLKIEKKLQKMTGVKKVLITSSPYDETVKVKNNYFPGKQAAMLEVADFQEASAKKNGWSFVDFARPMIAISKREQAKDSLFTLCMSDRIHPENSGHLVMAYTFLKAQGLAGQKVAGVGINATQKKVTLQDNCTISGLTVSQRSVRFNYLAKSLPYPIDTVPHGWNVVKKASDALPVIPFMEEFNRELVQVSGLKDTAHYSLKIDGQLMGVWTGSEWNEGVNLAAIYNTPQYQQSMAIMHLNEERWEIERRFRNYNYLEFNTLKPRGLLYKDDQSTWDTLEYVADHNKDIFVKGNLDNYSRARFKGVREGWQREMDALVNEIYQINKPLVRKIEIEEL